jgi:PAT family beta-lactamase induction signal transducer AmpG
MALIVVIIAVLSASQDVVIDAYRVEILNDDEQAAGAAVAVFGYRLGMIAAGAGVLILAEYAGWRAAYFTMAALMGVGILTFLCSPEPGAAQTEKEKTLLAWIVKTYGPPLLDFFMRLRGRSILIVIFILAYKIGDAVLGHMTGPFYIELGFTKDQIAFAEPVFGMWALIVGALAGGWSVRKWGLMRALLICGILQMVSNLGFAALALAGPDIKALFAVVGVEKFTGGMGMAAFVGYLSALCNKKFTATQYALLSSLMAVPRTVISSGSGYLADHMDWTTFFVATAVLALPGVLMAALMKKELSPEGKKQKGNTKIRIILIGCVLGILLYLSYPAIQIYYWILFRR